MRRASRFLIATAVSVAVTLLLTYGCYHLRLWTGGHFFFFRDLVRDFLFNVLLGLAVVVGVIVALWPSPDLKRNAMTAIAVGAAIGLSYAYLVPRVMWWVHFRTWRGNFGGSIFLSFDWALDIELVVCGVAAGICAMTLALARMNRTVWAAIVTIVIVAVAAPQPLFDRITHNQELTLAVMIPRPATSVLEAPENNYPARTAPSDLAALRGKITHLLRESGVEDKYQLVYVHHQGHGRPVLAVVLVDKPVVRKAELPEPRDHDAIFIQGNDDWKVLPPHLATVGRGVLMWPPEPTDRNFGTLMIQDAAGFGEGFMIPSPSQRRE